MIQNGYWLMIGFLDSRTGVSASGVRLPGAGKCPLCCKIPSHSSRLTLPQSTSTRRSSGMPSHCGCSASPKGIPSGGRTCSWIIRDSGELKQQYDSRFSMHSPIASVPYPVLASIESTSDSRRATDTVDSCSSSAPRAPVLCGSIKRRDFDLLAAVVSVPPHIAVARHALSATDAGGTDKTAGRIVLIRLALVDVLIIPQTLPATLRIHPAGALAVVIVTLQR